MWRAAHDVARLAGAGLGYAGRGAAVGWHRAAVLHGATQALLDRTGAPWDPSTRDRQESLHQAGAALGDDQFQQAYARGMTLSFDQAIDPALGRALPAA